MVRIFVAGNQETKFYMFRIAEFNLCTPEQVRPLSQLDLEA